MSMCTRWFRLLCTAALAMGFSQAAMAQTGACCTSPAGACSSQTASGCVGTNIFIGVGTSCTPTPCQGACCSYTVATQALVCSQTTPALCTNTGTTVFATFLGVGNTCTVDPCPSLKGLCCTVLGACTVSTAAGCPTPSVFQGLIGSAASCTPTNPCFASAGACCATNGACTLTAPTACAVPSIFGGVGSACLPSNPCLVPTGACCDNTPTNPVCSTKPAPGSGATGACNSPSVYLGNSVACSPSNICNSLVGACCTNATTCSLLTNTACGATTTNTFFGVNTLCSPFPCPIGACCSSAANSGCTVTLASGCTGANTWQGAGVPTCSPSSYCDQFLGVCCSGTGACTRTTIAGCSATSVFSGPNATACSTTPCTTLTPLGACCNGPGSCTVTAALGCTGANTFTANPAVCTPNDACQIVTGACCSAISTCSIATAAGCTGSNIFRGTGTSCLPTSPCTALLGACCSAIGACTIANPTSCFGQTNSFIPGGTCLPNSDSCAGFKRACCDSLGNCTLAISFGCVSPSIFQPNSFTCTSVVCPPTQGSCCDGSGGCTFGTAVQCASPNIWTGGTICNSVPSPCVHSGVCCIGTLSCTASTSVVECQSVGGAFIPSVACASTPCVRPAVVISQIYPGGGTSSAVYKYDYVELFNRGTTDVVMTNWSLQFGSTSTQTFPSRATFSGTIHPGQYFLIQLASTNTTIGLDLPTPDSIPPESLNVNLDVGSGRLALVSNASALNNGCPSPFPVNIVDFVGYGPAAGTGVPTCSEGGSPTGNTNGNIYAFYRKANGCQDTDNNGSDFSQPLAPNPRNSSSPFYICGTTSTGACCIGESCSPATAAACASAPAGFMGEGTVCSPNPCLLAAGACCNGTLCTPAVQSANCASPSIFSFGRTCSPTPCTGSCCTGLQCNLTSSAACTSPNYFIAAGTCLPTDCTGPVAVQSGDIAYGASVVANQDAIQQIRGAGSPSPVRAGSWSKFNNLQVTRFDNFNHINHNAAGNMLSLDFGTTANGGIIYNLPTNGDVLAGGQLFSFTGANAPFGLQRSRIAGLSISPDNNRIACIGYDQARLYVLSYVPGTSIGTGAGASIDGGDQTDNNNFIFGFNITQGTTWLDNDTIIMWVLSAQSSVLDVYTVSVSGSGPTIHLGTPVLRLEIPDGKPNSSRFTSVAYNPQLIPGYMFLGSSAFQGVSLNSLYVVSISGTTFTLVKTLDLSASLQTEREVAIGPDRNLYLCQFAGSGTLATDPLIDKITLDANGDGVVSADEINALTDNSSVDFYRKALANTGSFNSIDIAITFGSCCSGTNCTINTPQFCSGPNGTYRGDNTTCISTPCVATGACCTTSSGACAPGLTQAACLALGGTTYGGDSSTCTPNNCPQPTGACCNGLGGCTPQTAANCSASGAYQGNNSACGPTNCGVCCRGATCNASIFTAAGCTTAGAAAGHSYVTGACGASHVSPCCNADYNKSGGQQTVGDIFNFLTDWFAHSLYAFPGGNGTSSQGPSGGTPQVAQIFNFLTDWFGAACPP